MKLIHKFKSPNFNERKSKDIKLVIIHYTALKSVSESIKYLCSKKNKVSSHFLISNKGDIYSLVSEKKRAWHAGYSYWKGRTDINSISIGIELDFSPTDKNNKFTNKLIFSLIFLINRITNKYKILPENVLGHSDIAPYRKIDPGNLFPWHILEEKNIANKIKKISKKNDVKFIGHSLNKKNFDLSDNKILFMLNYIGYDISLASKSKLNFDKLIKAYWARYWHNKNHNYNKNRIFNIIKLHYFNILLTK